MRSRHPFKLIEPAARETVGSKEISKKSRVARVTESLMRQIRRWILEGRREW